MKIILVILSWVIIFLGTSIYWAEFYFPKKFKEEYQKGVTVGKKSMEHHPTDTVMFTNTNKKLLKVDSIEFMIIHYNNSEVK